MASLVQLQKVSELEKEGYKIIGPKTTGGRIPMGGPTLLQSPDGRTVEVLAVEVLAVEVLAVEVLAVEVLAVEVLAVEVLAVEVLAVEVLAVEVLAVGSVNDPYKPEES